MKRTNYMKAVAIMFVMIVVCTGSLNSARCDFYDPVLNTTVPSDIYASYEDALNGTPSSEEAVRASKPAGYYDVDWNDPASVRAYHNKTQGGTGNSTSSNSGAISSEKARNLSPTLTEYDSNNQLPYIITSKKAVYDDFNKGRNEIGSVSKGTEVVVTGKSSNGYYRFDYTAEDGTTTTGYLLYEGKDNIVPKEDYDAAWSETERVEATCTEDGYIEYTNSYSGLTKKDEIKATGHVLGDEELTKEPTWTRPGEVVTHCANCNEIIETREIEPIVPMWCWYLIGGAVALCILTITVTVVIVRKRNRAAEITVE